MSEEEDRKLDKIIRRLDVIEARLDALRPNNTNTIVLDKELDRVLEQISTLQATYGGMQTWSPEDRTRIKKLYARQKELMALLGVRY